MSDGGVEQSGDALRPFINHTLAPCHGATQLTGGLSGGRLSA
jgi:hypothetical protein